MPTTILTSEDTIWIIARVAITFILTAFITRLFRTIWRKHAKNTIHRKFIGNILSAFITILGTIIALNWIPAFSTVVAAIIAGSGILALTIGLAAQESLGNAFSGLFISASKPFEVGDRVHLINADITGFIEDISIRHTIIRTLTNSRIIVPNSTMNKELIENANFCNPQAAAFIDVIITYDSDIDKARAIMAHVIGNHPDFVDTRTPEKLEEAKAWGLGITETNMYDSNTENKSHGKQSNHINDLESPAPKVPVLVRALGLYGVELRASMWTASISNNFAAASSVRKGILHEFNAAGVRIASSKIIDSLIQK